MTSKNNPKPISQLKLPVEYKIFILLKRKFNFDYDNEQRHILRERIERFVQHIGKLTKIMKNSK